MVPQVLFTAFLMSAAVIVRFIFKAPLSELAIGHTSRSFPPSELSPRGCCAVDEINNSDTIIFRQ